MTRIAAHLIVGDPEEPFLPAMLESIAGWCEKLIVNDNSSQASAHETVLRASAFGREDRLLLDRTPFRDFASARNACLELHRKLAAGDWIVFIDADEVHGLQIKRIAARLDRVARDVDFVDGYTWHFFQSFDWYTSIERRMMFFRFRPEVRWEGSVHEQLRGLSGSRLALPYVYAHYGHVLSAKRHAVKGRQYSSLGAPGAIVAEEALDSIDVREYFRNFWPALLRFTGSHPPAAAQTIASLRAALAEQFLRTDRLVRENQPALRRWKNFFLKLNYEQRWRSRSLNPRARLLL